MTGKKAAIIGFGGMGQRHFQAYRKNGIDVTAICEWDEKKVRQVLPQFPGEEIYSRYQDLLQESDVDIVSVVTNGPTHAEITLAAARAGIGNVLCEKPMATSLREAAEVIRVCEETGTRLAVNHIRRWSSNYHRLRDLLRSGIIGEPRHFYFSCGSTGLGNFAIHFFDTVRFLSGSEPSQAVGFLDRTGTPNPRGRQFVDPGGYGIITLENGARFFVDTMEDTGVQYTFQVVGTFGRIAIDELNDEWRIRARDASARALPLTRYGTGMGEIPFASDARFDIVDLTANAQRELVAGKAISSTGREGYRSLEMVIALHASDARGNVPVKFPLAGEDLARVVPIG
ncbi:MAG: Gfo/Idh/MocA family oxidoreductase [Methanomicrobiales archaeon]|nr:Gfo/Idh/MocA family oxidoreductase [Methanomicrobiales archaeon]